MLMFHNSDRWDNSELRYTINYNVVEKLIYFSNSTKIAKLVY